MRAVARAVTLDQPISATLILAEIAERLVRQLLVDHPDERTISLLAISVCHLGENAELQLELPLGLQDEKRRPGAKRGMARLAADRAVDKVRAQYAFRHLAEREL
jgi:DNA polymerase IV